MSRIRTIKPAFFLHEQLADLSPLHRLAFIGLWTQADREGRLEDRPKRLKAEVLPYDDCDFVALLNDLERGGFIERYDAEGRALILIPKLGTHQRFHHKELASTLPGPGKQRSTTRRPRTVNRHGRPVHESSMPVHDAPDPVTAAQEGKGTGREEEQEGKGREGKKESGVLTHRREKAAPDPRVQPVIAAFYERYKAETGQTYCVTAADGEAIRRLPKDKTAEYLTALVERFFVEADGWTREKAGFTIRHFCQRIPSLETSGAQAVPGDAKLSRTVANLQAFTG